jgi:energy-coupling factor transporter ATP-binding protein EcfA2
LSRVHGARGLPHLAFLCCCESAHSEAEGALGGIGKRLVRELGIPAVVAMSEVVSIETSEALAARFYERLVVHGSVDTALDEACAELAERGDVTVPALYSRLRGRKLFDDEGAPVPTANQIAHGLARVEKLLPERANTLVGEFQPAAATLRGLLEGGAEYEELSKEARLEFGCALDGLEAICDEVFDLSFRALARGKEPTPQDLRCPFPGMLPFYEGEDGKKEFFYGREALIGDLKARLDADRFLVVLGASGSGKSSIVRAGLLAEYRKELPGFRIIVFTPGSDPLATWNHARASVPLPRDLIVVDQFEELFTVCTNGSARRRFLDALLPLRGETKLVLIMRADFLGDCANDDRLRPLVERYQKLIGPMDEQELRRAMDLQCLEVGLRFEGELSGELIDDVTGEPGAMPLLQHALLQLWKRRHGRWLKGNEYRDPDKVGGLKQAIARTANAIFDAASAADRDLMKFLFVRLARIDTDSDQRERRRDSRRREPIARLTPVGVDQAVSRRVVDMLTDSRLLVKTTHPVSHEVFVEVAHEALIRHWGLLGRWLDEACTDERLIARIRAAAEAWESAAGDRSHLSLHGSVLAEAEALPAPSKRRLTDAEDRFIKACRAEETAGERRRRNVTLVLFVDFMLALAASAIAYREYFKASDLATRNGQLAGSLDTTNGNLRGANEELKKPRRISRRRWTPRRPAAPRPSARAGSPRPASLLLRRGRSSTPQACSGARPCERSSSPGPPSRPPLAPDRRLNRLPRKSSATSWRMSAGTALVRPSKPGVKMDAGC